MRAEVRCAAWRGSVVAGVLALALTACGKTKREHYSPNGFGGQVGEAAASGDAAAANGGSGADSGASAGGEGGAITSSWVPAPLRRLTANEYTATVGDVLGASQVPQLPHATVVDCFDNNAAANGVSVDDSYHYLAAAESVAEQVFASAALRPQIVTCSAADDATCVESIIQQIGLRLFRRPLLAGEVTAYEKAYARARARMLSHEGSLKEVLTALLVSAQFVYRMELEPSATDTVPFGQYALAARLSYLLWSSAPDSELQTAAQRQALGTDEQVRAELTRLLDDAKSFRFARDFMGQWLGERALDDVRPDSKLYREWTPEVSTAAANELQSFFTELLGSGQDIRGLFNSRVHFVTPQLAPFYGLSVASGTQRVLQMTGERQGLLGMVGFLAQTAMPKRSSPSLRGAWIVQNLLCQAIPGAPSPMPEFDDVDSNIKPYLAGMSPSCVDCHQRFDSLGLALESYDAIGYYRSEYSDHTPIDAQVTLPASAGGMSASGTAGVSAALASSPAFFSCSAQKLLTYAFGRAFDESDPNAVHELTSQWQGGQLTMRELISKLVLSSEFEGGSQ